MTDLKKKFLWLLYEEQSLERPAKKLLHILHETQYYFRQVEMVGSVQKSICIYLINSKIFIFSYIIPMQSRYILQSVACHSLISSIFSQQYCNTILYIQHIQYYYVIHNIQYYCNIYIISSNILLCVTINAILDSMKQVIQKLQPTRLANGII